MPSDSRKLLNELIEFTCDFSQRATSRLRNVWAKQLSIVFGHALEEKDLALQGRAFANDMFRNADTIEFRNLKWDKYGGRILADVYIDGMSYKQEIIEAGLAREYYGGKKIGWCD